jgi:hypothetical protein
VSRRQPGPSRLLSVTQAPSTGRLCDVHVRARSWVLAFADTAHVRAADRPGHCLDYVPGISQPPSTYSLTTCDLTSHERSDLRGGRPTAQTQAQRPEPLRARSR